MIALSREMKQNRMAWLTISAKFKKPDHSFISGSEMADTITRKLNEITEPLRGGVAFLKDWEAYLDTSQVNDMKLTGGRDLEGMNEKVKVKYFALIISFPGEKLYRWYLYFPLSETIKRLPSNPDRMDDLEDYLEHTCDNISLFDLTNAWINDIRNSDHLSSCLISLEYRLSRGFQRAYRGMGQEEADAAAAKYARLYFSDDYIKRFDQTDIILPHDERAVFEMYDRDQFMEGVSEAAKTKAIR